MVICFLRALNFGQSNNMFYEISTFFKHNFLRNFPVENELAPVNFIILYISPLKSSNLVLIPGAKLIGHRGTWTGCLHRFEL